MLVMDGYEIIREIRKVERNYGVYILIIVVFGYDFGLMEVKDII